MTKKEAKRVLRMGIDSLNQSIFSQKIKLDEKGRIDDESVYQYLKELQERKKISNQNWINTSSY